MPLSSDQGNSIFFLEGREYMNVLYNNLEIVIEHVVRTVPYHFMYLPALAVALVSSLLGSSVCSPERRYLVVQLLILP